MDFASAGADVQFFPSAPGQITESEHPRLIRDGDSLRLRLSRDAAAAAPRRLTGLLVASSAAVTKAIEVDAPVVPAVPVRAGYALIAALGLAFVGGLLLNLMPCVLPVISLKVLSILRQGEGHGARHGALFTLGVLVSFWVIAAVLAALRAGGRLLGWGFQFQDPVVVIVSAVLFFLIGLNLFGVFEIGTSLTRLGGRLRGTAGAGSFLTGVFATAVATPCTAPFMGVAVGYALSHSSAASFGVFTALGLGMAAPSLALSLAPGLSARLPKPGSWMQTFRQVMAFPMMAAVVWMASVLASQAGASGLVALLAAMFAAGLGGWIWGRWGTLSRPRAVRGLAGALALVLVVGSTTGAALFAPRQVTVGERGSAPVRPAGPWQPWSPQRVEELRKAGTPVFVDFTATWCLTCLVNERVALGNPSVRNRFAEAGVATLRADWTDANEEISRALAGFGRAGVPLYVYYPSGGRDPVVLPEILTPGIVLSILRSN